MSKPRVLVIAWLPDGVLPKLQARFPQLDFIDARDPAGLGRSLPAAAIAYGLPPVDRLADAPGLRWIQLISAGVPPELCQPAQEHGVLVTNLAGLYGPSIAEHAFALVAVLARNLHVAFRN